MPAAILPLLKNDSHIGRLVHSSLPREIRTQTTPLAKLAYYYTIYCRRTQEISRHTAWAPAVCIRSNKIVPITCNGPYTQFSFQRHSSPLTVFSSWLSTRTWQLFLELSYYTVKLSKWLNTVLRCQVEGFAYPYVLDVVIEKRYVIAMQSAVPATTAIK